MSRFIGVKSMEAEKQRSLIPTGAYEKDSPGYSVVYPDGHTAWCPEKVFEKYNFPIVGEHNTISETDVNNMMQSIAVSLVSVPDSINKITIVICTLVNGFTLTESSTCVDPANYNEEIGRDICLAKIKDKIWFLLGFLLQSASYGFGSNKKEEI